jgi:uncharacterized protein (UPF0128 family)
LAEIRDIEKKIKKNTGLFAKIQVKRNGAGQVAILFENKSQMEKIIERLS